MKRNFIPNYNKPDIVNSVNHMFEPNIPGIEITQDYKELVGYLIGLHSGVEPKSLNEAMSMYTSVKHVFLSPTKDEMSKAFMWVKPDNPSVESIATISEVMHFNSITNFFCNKSFEKWVKQYEEDNESYDKKISTNFDIEDYFSYMQEKKSVKYHIEYRFFSTRSDSDGRVMSIIANECFESFIINNPVDDFSFIMKKGTITNSKSLKAIKESFGINQIDSLLRSTVSKIGIATIIVTKIDCKSGVKTKLPYIICIV